MATAQYLTPLALELAGRGHTVTVITSRRGYDDQAREFPAREIWRGIQIIRVGSTRLGKAAKWRRAVDFASFMLNCAVRAFMLPRQDAVVALTSPPLISALGAVLTLFETKDRGPGTRDRRQRAEGRGPRAVRDQQPITSHQPPTTAATRNRPRFIYWVMDLNPDEAIAAGWLRPNSPAARILEWVSRFSMRQASRIVVLDRFTRERVLAKGLAAEKVSVLPLWRHDEAVGFDSEGRAAFRARHGLENKYVVMYSGNHSPCHPLDTLLAAARLLAGSCVRENADPPSSDLRPPVPEPAFLFIGGGSELERVKRFAAEHRLTNIKCLPYQPMEELSASLSAADLHVVVMGDPFVGIIHPSKIYNILGVIAGSGEREAGSAAESRGNKEHGARSTERQPLIAYPLPLPLSPLPPSILYIGPRLSHVTEILEPLGPARWDWTRHGDVDAVIRAIRARMESGRRPLEAGSVPGRFSKSTVLPHLADLICA